MKRSFWARAGATAAVLALACAVAAAAADSVSSNAVFLPIAAGLRKSAVPVLLPGRLPADDAHGLRAELRSAGKAGYAIDLDYSADCNGASACYLGAVSGRRSDGSKLPGTATKLANGTTAYYVQGACGASCSNSTMTFDTGGDRYVFAAKGASQAYLEVWTQSLRTLGEIAP